ncbi:unnamed protein product [Zymoseptoria tritici ST99CH_1A5]|uniref:Uncharacterized protein n=1 Tax=Zymoseptoria tritici ST99CH_1A5 TaxID=1276529 RepID=A0A1Y6LYY6_ZYMTR|nr:unnamed protein product [Zymoseptoria tritici ST99CH_1A5]
MFYIEEMTTEQKQRVRERVKSGYLSRLERPMKTLNLNTSFELSMLPDRKTHGKLRAYAFDSCQEALNCSLQRVERLSSRRKKLEILEERYRHDKGNEDLRDELEELQGDIWRANHGSHAYPTIHQDYKDK